MLLESHPPGRCPLRDHIAASVQLRHDSPLGQHPSPMAELSDDQLAEYCDRHLGDDALAAAVAPINEWIDAQRQAPEWALVADRMNAYLGAWSAPPWTAEEVNTMAMALAMAQEGACG